MLYTPAPDPVPSYPHLSLRKQMAVWELAVNHELDQVVEYEDGAEILTRVVKRVHEESWFRSVLEGRVDNGFGNRNPDVTAHAVWSVMSFIEASLSAHLLGACVFAPVSGFHHAGYQHAAGYCTFNGLVLAAEALREVTPGARVLILDGDAHWGDGTHELLCRGDRNTWLKQWHIGDPKAGGQWRSRLLKVFEKRVDLVMYQAGADAHIDDPYQGGHLTTGALLARDQFIFQACHDAGVPIVWNLAGGYNGLKTLDLHAATWDAAAAIYEPEVVRFTPRAAALSRPGGAPAAA